MEDVDKDELYSSEEETPESAESSRDSPDSIDFHVLSLIDQQRIRRQYRARLLQCRRLRQRGILNPLPVKAWRADKMKCSLTAADNSRRIKNRIAAQKSRDSFRKSVSSLEHAVAMQSQRNHLLQEEQKILLRDLAYCNGSWSSPHTSSSSNDVYYHHHGFTHYIATPQLSEGVQFTTPCDSEASCGQVTPHSTYSADHSDNGWTLLETDELLGDTGFVNYLWESP